MLDTLVKIGGEGGTVTGGRVVRLSESVEKLVKIVLGRNKKVSLRERKVLVEVWRLNKTAFLDIDCTVLAQILEICTDGFTAEIESFILEALEVKVSEVSQPSTPSIYPPPTILCRTVATSQNLFTRSVQIFSTFLLESSWNSNLLHLYRSFISAVLSHATNPILLYPYTSQSLASLLLTYRDLTNLAMRSQLVETIRNNFDMKDWGVQIVCLQFPEFVEELK